jgi:hypothetical protein
LRHDDEGIFSLNKNRCGVWEMWANVDINDVVARHTKESIEYS